MIENDLTSAARLRMERSNLMTLDGPLVYVFRASELGRLKVGYTGRTLQGRFRAVQQGCPTVLEPMEWMPGTRDVEQAIHADLREYRIIGEWFEDCENVRQYLLDRGFKPISQRMRDFLVPNRPGRCMGVVLRPLAMDAVTRRSRETGVSLRSSASALVLMGDSAMDEPLEELFQETKRAETSLQILAAMGRKVEDNPRQSGEA